MNIRPEHRRSSQQFFAGVDGGGTGCRAAISDAAGAILGKAVAGAANLYQNPSGAYANVLDALQSACKSANLSSEQINGLIVVAGLAGAESEAAKSEFLAKPLPFRQVSILHDSTIALAGAHRGEDGGLVIIGTGIVAAYKKAGMIAQIGGWGFPLDDRGSGAWLGQLALQTCLRTQAGIYSGNQVSNLIWDHFGRDEQNILNFAKTARPSEYAALAPLVWQAAASNDALANQMIEQLVKEVELLLGALENKGVHKFALAGGMANNIADRLTPKWASRLSADGNSPLDGALQIARTIARNDTPITLLEATG